jgi:hypothetical protein
MSGTILRGPQYNYNPQIHTEANSLTHKMAKHMEIRKKAFDLNARYAKVSSFAASAGMVNSGAMNGKVKKDSEGIYDNAYRVHYEGALFTPSLASGSVRIGEWYDASNPTPDMLTGNVGVTFVSPLTESTLTTDTLISIAVQHDPANGIDGSKIQPHESIILDNNLGTELIVARGGRKASTGDHYVYDGKIMGGASLFKSAHLAEGTVLTYGGTRFGEGSLYGNQKTYTNKWRINYSHIQRYTLTMTLEASKQKVSMLYNEGTNASSGLWEYTEVLKAEQQFALGLEQGLRVSRMTMDPTNHKWFENYGANTLTLSGFTAQGGLTAPMSGDGWIPQIEEANLFEYGANTGVEVAYFEAIMNVLSQRSPKGSTGNLFILVTDRIGTMVVDKSLKKLTGWAQTTTTNQASSIVVNVTTGAENKVGFSFNKYHYLGNDFVVFEDELLNNPAMYPTNGGITGSGNIYIINASPIDGVPNFDILNRAGSAYIKKYEDGLTSFDPAGESAKVSSGFAGKKVHLYSEQMAMVYAQKACGILKNTQAYNGGALAASQWLTDNPDSRSFLF